jgi:predicted transcriptional regulator
VVLPVIDYEGETQELMLSENILLLLSEKGALSRVEIEENTGYKRTRVLTELEQLIGNGLIEMVGSGPSVKYRIK